MHKLLMTAVGLFSTVCTTGTALAQDDTSPVDDRSDGAALIRSLYDAINRKDFERAYSYFSEDKNVVDYPTFVKGYENTLSVRLVIGTVTPEGAAGSIYAPVPVAIQSTEKGEKVRVFAGCYITRMPNSGAPDAASASLHIESADLKEVEGPVENAVPKTCTPPS